MPHRHENGCRSCFGMGIRQLWDSMKGYKPHVTQLKGLAVSNVANSLCVIIALLLHLIFITSVAAAPAQTESIWPKFVERQGRSERADIIWIHRRLLTKNSSAIAELRSSGPVDLAMDRLFQEQQCRLVASGERLRVEDLTLASSGGQGHFLPTTVAFDGAMRRRLTDYSRVNEDPSGGISDEWRALAWADVHLLALTFALRPLRPEAFGNQPSAWTIRPEVEMVEGVHCTVLERRLSKRTERVCVDPNRSFVPLKLVSGSISVTMRYERNEEPEWIPSSWTATVYTGPNSGVLESQSENELVSAEIGKPINDELFQIQFPPKTRVLDGRGTGLPALFIADDAGNLIPQRREVAQRTADEGWGRWPLIFAAIGAAVLGGALLLRRRRNVTV